MAFEVVKEIINIEREGEELVKKAQALALEIQKSARDEYNAIIQRADEDAENYYTNEILKYEDEAGKIIKSINDSNASTIASIRSIPVDVLDHAVNMVIERIVNSHGNS